MLAKIWNDFCDDVLSTKKKKSKEIDFERGPVKDFLTSLGWVKYGSHCLVEQHPIQFATANHYADFALFLQNEENVSKFLINAGWGERGVRRIEDVLSSCRTIFNSLLTWWS